MKDFKSFLARRGLKATSQRMAVHESMLKLVHASADQVAADIAARTGKKVTMSSVYNILNDMTCAGAYVCRIGAAGKMFFDVDPGSHIHLFDMENNVFKDVVDEELASMVKEHLSHRRFRGYSIENINVQILVRSTKKRR